MSVRCVNNYGERAAKFSYLCCENIRRLAKRNSRNPKLRFFFSVALREQDCATGSHSDV